MPVPIIDLFAGPGGLGEGFSSCVDASTNERQFKIAVSVEKDAFAHRTLSLRAFLRQFPIGDAPEAYYEYVKRQISRDPLQTLTGWYVCVLGKFTDCVYLKIGTYRYCSRINLLACIFPLP